MLTVPIQYKDFDGNDREQKFYFNFNEAELARWITETKGDLTDQLTEIANSGDGGQIIRMFDDFIARTYGVRTEAGGFRKGGQVLQEFLEHPAYSVFFMRLVTEPNYAAQFVNEVMPADLMERSKKLAADREQLGKHVGGDMTPVPQPMPRVIEDVSTSTFGPAAEQNGPSPLLPMYDPQTGAKLR